MINVTKKLADRYFMGTLIVLLIVHLYLSFGLKEYKLSILVTNTLILVPFILYYIHFSKKEDKKSKMEKKKAIALLIGFSFFFIVSFVVYFFIGKEELRQLTKFLL